MTSPAPKNPRRRAIWFLDNIQRFLCADVARILPGDDRFCGEIKAMADRWMKELAELARRMESSGE